MTTNTIPKDSRWDKAFGEIYELKPGDPGWFKMNSPAVVIVVGVEIGNEVVCSQFQTTQRVLDDASEEFEQFIFSTLIREIDRALEKKGYENLRGKNTCEHGKGRGGCYTCRDLG